MSSLAAEKVQTWDEAHGLSQEAQRFENAKTKEPEGEDVQGEERSLPQCCWALLSFKNSKWLFSKLKCSPSSAIPVVDVRD